MEALEMTTWNDERLNELSGRTDAGFEEVKGGIQDLRAEMQAGFARVDERFEKIDERFEKVDEEFKDVRREMRAGFARVDQEFKEVRKEMQEGFAQTVTRDEMNERFSAVDKRLGDLTRWVQIFVGVVGAAFVGNGLLG
jgi:predicted  nucleic acid-binding Zn-ribbon protein